MGHYLCAALLPNSLLWYESEPTVRYRQNIGGLVDMFGFKEKSERV